MRILIHNLSNKFEKQNFNLFTSSYALNIE